MKTVEIQLAITAAKGAIRDWKTEGDQGWTAVCQALDNIVVATIKTIPPTIQIEKVEVQISVPTPSEIIKEVRIEQQVLVPSAME